MVQVRPIRGTQPNLHVGSWRLEPEGTTESILALAGTVCHDIDDHERRPVTVSSVGSARWSLREVQQPGLHQARPVADSEAASWFLPVTLEPPDLLASATSTWSVSILATGVNIERAVGWFVD